MNTIYEDGTYIDNNPTWHEEDSSWKAKQIIKICKRNSIKSSTICEVGCGAGEILNQLSLRMGCDVKLFGYEVSPDAFNICRVKTKNNLRFFLKDLIDEDVYYDLVMSIDVFEHVEDYFGFLKSLRSKGKYKIFHIPLDLSVQGILRASPIKKIRNKGGHLHYFTKDTALATLEDTGYTILDYFYTSGSLELPKKGLKAKFLKIPRIILFSLNKDLAVRLLGGFSLMVLTE